jgi:hypothetical protein
VNDSAIYWSAPSATGGVIRRMKKLDASHDAGTDTALAPVCPAVPPPDLAPCSARNGEVCTFGDSVSPECRTKVLCYKPDDFAFLGGHAEVTTLPCEASPACPTSKPAEGDPCAQEGAVCEYPGAGAVCACVPCSSTGCDASPSQWQCAAPPGGPCPALAPNQGVACTAADLECLYGSCGTIRPDAGKAGVLGPVVATCNEGIWKWAYAECPE